MTEITRGTVPSWTPEKAKAPVEPKPAPKKRTVKAKAKPVHHKPKHEALVVLHGGPYDGRQTTVSSHDVERYSYNDACYERQDQQEGDYRVYRFTTADGEALPTSQSAGPEQENLLHRDLAQQNEIYEPGSGFHAPRKAAAKK